MSDNPFLKALDVLDERGWGQGQYEDKDGRVCAYGALAYACGGHVHRNPNSSMVFIDDVSMAYDFAGTLASRLSGMGDLVLFNDDPHTTEEDVRLLFKEAAEKWEEQ